jgi:hypothetical protein
VPPPLARIRLLTVALLVATARVALAVPAHYLVFEVDPAGVRLAFHRIVEMAAPPPSLEATEAAALVARAPRDAVRMTVRLVDAGGRVVHRTVAETSREIRGEFHGADEIDGHHIPRAGGAFVVRVPVVDGTRLEVDGPPGGHRIAVTARELATSLAASAAPPPIAAAAMSGSAANRVDLVVLGDGYTAAQHAKFDADAGNALSAFFGITPYAEYASFVNTYTVFTPSPQSGADHPPYDAACGGGVHSPSCCADGDALSDPKAGTFVTTALDATFCSFNIHRLLVVDETKAFTAAAAVPDWDVVLVVVNDDTYGGSGGVLGVFSDNASAIEIARHEYGHSFSLLADEYSTSYPGYPPCDDVGGGPPCDPNVTNQTVRAAIKWAPWIAGSTPVPTPDTGAYANAVGLFEGARYLASGMYRPRHTCLMRQLAVPFCEVCRQEYVLRLYEGGWGTPSGGIDTIEPGSEYPPPGNVDVHFPDFVGITVQLLQPSGPPIGVSWSVDGVPVPGQTQPSFNFTPSAQGTYEIVLTTHDPTTFVAPAIAGVTLTRTRTWTVTFDPSVSTSTSSSTTTSTSTSTTLPPLCADGVAITRPVVVERGGGGRKVLTMRGTLEFAFGQPDPFDPAANGMQLELVDAGGAATIVSLTAASSPIPGGPLASACGLKDGWRGLTYRNVSTRLDPPACTAGSARGLRLVKLRDRRGRGRGISVVAKIVGEIPALTGPLELTLVTSADRFAGAAGACGETVVASCLRKPKRIVCR